MTDTGIASTSTSSSAQKQRRSAKRKALAEKDDQCQLPLSKLRKLTQLYNLRVSPGATKVLQTAVYVVGMDIAGFVAKSLELNDLKVMRPTDIRLAIQMDEEYNMIWKNALVLDASYDGYIRKDLLTPKKRGGKKAQPDEMPIVEHTSKTHAFYDSAQDAEHKQAKKKKKKEEKTKVKERKQQSGDTEVKDNEENKEKQEKKKRNKGVLPRKTKTRLSLAKEAAKQDPQNQNFPETAPENPPPATATPTVEPEAGIDAVAAGAEEGEVEVETESVNADADADVDTAETTELVEPADAAEAIEAAE